MPGQGGSRKVARNALYNSAAWAGSVLIALLVTPYVVRKLGIEGYGVYALLTSVVGYYTLLDLGLGQGVTKFVAEFAAHGRTDAVASAIDAALRVQVLVGLAAASVLMFFADPLLHVIGVPGALWRDAKRGTYAVAAGFFFTMVAGTFSAALMGLQRFDVTSRFSLLTNAVLNLTIVLLLHAGYGLKEAVYATTGVALVLLVGYFVVLRVELPAWRPSLRYDRAGFRTLFRFSGYAFLAKLAPMFNGYIIRFVVGVMLGPAAVTFYVVPMRIISAIGGFLGSIAVVLFPFTSELAVAGGRNNLERLYVRASRYLLAIAFPVYLVLMVFSFPVLSLWMGSNFARQSAGVLSALAAAYLVSAATMVPGNMALGLGRSRLAALFAGGTLAVGLASVFPLTTLLGVDGTALAVAASQSVGLVFISYVTVKVLRLGLVTYVRDVAGFHLIGVIPGLLCLFGAKHYLAGVPMWWLLLVGFGFVVTYYGALVVLDWVPVADVRKLIRRR